MTQGSMATTTSTTLTVSLGNGSTSAEEASTKSTRRSAEKQTNQPIRLQLQSIDQWSTKLIQLHPDTGTLRIHTGLPVRKWWLLLCVVYLVCGCPCRGFDLLGRFSCCSDGSSRPATSDFCRQEAGGWPHPCRLQHPKGVHTPPGAPPPW
ncbi:uncharacterized protein LOC120713666 isoform X3 [Panicum virgatum]|uniref:uncharacterized protein LOC120713666 isoform X3 n=1 Tax=Panicum virgatum TaxID=38727 RepID=UPI0019D514EE|nr:uncharacterized protein LOC120713666 isoform X3 [Panicum virgatum]